jgi:hypothetical protein
MKELSLWRNSPPFMEAAGSLSCSKETVTRLYPGPGKSSLHPQSTYWFHFNIILTFMPKSPKWSLPSGFPTTVCMNFSFLICVTCLYHPILLDYIILIIFGEEYKLWCSSLYNFLQPPDTYPLLRPSILLHNTFSTTLNFYSSFKVSHQVSCPAPKVELSLCV